MRLNAPTQLFFIISLILAIVGLVGFLGVAIITPYAFWILFAGYVVLALACMLKGM